MFSLLAGYIKMVENFIDHRGFTLISEWGYRYILLFCECFLREGGLLI